jgi:hypothetical protein
VDEQGEQRVTVPIAGGWQVGQKTIAVRDCAFLFREINRREQVEAYNSSKPIQIVAGTHGGRTRIP